MLIPHSCACSRYRGHNTRCSFMSAAPLGGGPRFPPRARPIRHHNHSSFNFRVAETEPTPRPVSIFLPSRRRMQHELNGVKRAKPSESFEITSPNPTLQHESPCERSQRNNLFMCGDLKLQVFLVSKSVTTRPRNNNPSY